MRDTIRDHDACGEDDWDPLWVEGVSVHDFFGCLLASVGSRGRDEHAGDDEGDACDGSDLRVGE